MLFTPHEYLYLRQMNMCIKDSDTEINSYRFSTVLQTNLTGLWILKDWIREGISKQ